MRIQNIHELLYKDDDKTLLLECLDTRTHIFPCAIRDDKNNVCVAFAGSLCKARSLRKATSSFKADTTKKIIAVLAKNDGDEKFSGVGIYLKRIKPIREKLLFV